MYGSRLATTTTRTPARRSLSKETRRSRDHSVASRWGGPEGSHLSIASRNDLASPPRAGTARDRVQKSVPISKSPTSTNFNDNVDGFVHILDRCPFEPGMKVMLPGKKVRGGEAHERQPGTVRSTANLLQLRRQARGLECAFGMGDDFGI